MVKLVLLVFVLQSLGVGSVGSQYDLLRPNPRLCRSNALSGTFGSKAVFNSRNALKAQHVAVAGLGVARCEKFEGFKRCGRDYPTFGAGHSNPKPLNPKL